MKRYTSIKIWIIILIICLFLILILLYNLINSINKKNNNVNMINNETTSNESSTENSQVTSENQTNFNDINKETGDGEYSREQLNNFDFSITNIPDDVKSYINDINEFNITVKEYIYINGLVQATIGDFERYQIQQETNKLAIVLKLNNPRETKLLIIIDLTNNNIEISEYE